MIGSNHAHFRDHDDAAAARRDAVVTALTVVAVFCGAVSLALAVSGRHSGGRAVPVAELVMLAAMLDLHLPPLGVLPAPLWSLLLMGCAIGVAFTDRLRRSRGTASAGDHLHAASMLLAAVLVMFLGAEPGQAPSAAHSHGAASSASVILITGLVVAAYASAVVALVVRRRPKRVETVRRFASLAALVAMAGMTAGPLLA